MCVCVVCVVCVCVCVCVFFCPSLIVLSIFFRVARRNFHEDADINNPTTNCSQHYIRYIFVFTYLNHSNGERKLANSVNPVQTAPKARVYTVCHSHYNGSDTSSIN